MRFKGLDLNLLLALDVLLDTRSVSAAAKRLNLSQPAMSAALSRLREYFGDELLVTRGRRMHPTARAESLIPQLRSCLSDIDALVTSSGGFDPSVSRRTFTIAASDYVIAAVLVPFIEALAADAPGVSINMVLPSDDTNQQFADGKIDLQIVPEQQTHPGLPAELLFEERQVVAGWTENPIFAAPLTEAAVLSCGHVAVAVGAQRSPSFADRQLANLGKTRRVEVTAPSFTVAPWLVQGTNRLIFTHERLAIAMARHFPITVAPIPFAFPVMREMLQVHDARADDEALQWLRGRLHGAANYNSSE
jgi:DNA-binding transcriptional LysR family regulator